MTIIRRIIKEKWGLFVCLLIICFQLGTFAYLGEKSFITIHDNLDSNLVWYKLIIDNDLTFRLSGMLPMLGGINRMALASGLHVYYLFYSIFSPFWAHVLIYITKAIVGMFSFKLLASEMIKRKNKIYENLFYLVGFAFGACPLFPSAAFAAATLPLIGFFVLKFYNTKKWYWGLSIFIYPVFSTLISFGFFIITYLLIYTIVLSFINKKICYRMLLAICLLCFGYIAIEYNLIYYNMNNTEQSIKSLVSTGMVFEGAIDLIKGLWVGFEQYFITAHYHAQSLHYPIILSVCIIYFIWHNIEHLKNKDFKGIIKSPYNILILLIVFNSLIASVYQYEYFRTIFGAIFPPLKGLNFGRFFWLSPLIWYLAFLMVLIRLFDYRKLLVYILVFAQIGFVCFKADTQYSFFGNTLKYGVFEKATEELNFDEFFSESLFDQVKEDIDYNNEWSVSFGFHPAVLNYNNIATLDGYYTSYSQEYKDNFRRLIEPLLNTDEDIRLYFDNWGGRAYVFPTGGSNAVQPNRSAIAMYSESDILINPDVFKEMGGKYVFSRLIITNADEMGLELVGEYSNSVSPYTIYLYVMP